MSAFFLFACSVICNRTRKFMKDRTEDAEISAIIAATVYAGSKYSREVNCGMCPDKTAKYDRVFFMKTTEFYTD